MGRSAFRETGPLEDFARSEIASLEISEADFITGSWTDRIDDLLALGSVPEKVANGSGAAARWIMEAMAKV